ncbi:secreted protein [Amylocarpus encephaloides]|uniref:Secreted protein n=1 Tax=Amylocarpus encephaloides TaxID=45428 RepID=A0A9P7YJ34_9HELO|nr:secreted protein [Amylocarpus encephaloides]
MKGLLGSICVIVATIVVFVSCFQQPLAPDGVQRSSLVVDSGESTFAAPHAIARPKFRYWLPDASVSPAKLAADFKGIRDIGAGGVELVSYYNYGAEDPLPLPPKSIDWSIYGFGTPAFNKVLKAALQASKDNGLLFDFEIGAQSGQGAPAELPNIGLTYSLESYQKVVQPGKSFLGPVPGYGAGILVSVVTAKITHTQPGSPTTYTLSDGTLQEVTKFATQGQLNLTFPESGSSYLLYASYYVQPLKQSVIGGHDPQNFIQNGSFCVDHFSAAGAKVTTDFLAKYVFVDGAKELMKDIGQYIWEDSNEIGTTDPYWTPRFSQAFKDQHGYDITPYLPLIRHGNGHAYSPATADSYITDGPDRGQGIVADWRATLSSLYGEYLTHLNNWANNYLEVEFSTQVGYNLPLDMLASVPLVDAPEGESLGFANNIDSFLQYTGPAHLVQKPIVSSETGATGNQLWSFTLSRLLSYVKIAFAGGVNQNVLHGSPYSWDYPETTWPGFTTFFYSVTDMHQRHQPAWEHGYPESMGWMSRTQFVLQSGVHKNDVVFWDKQIAQLEIDYLVRTLYPYDDLVKAGYTYSYLSSDNLALPQARVENGILAPDGPAYKALILRSSDTLTPGGVSRLAALANAGLPIVVAGGFPTSIVTSNPNDSDAARQTISTISKLSNVHVVPGGPVASSLQSVGITPQTQVSASQTWWTVRRQAPGVDYLFIYNQGADSTGTIAFVSSGVPYFFDAWSGARKPILKYTVKDGRIQIPLSLARDQTVIIAFTTKVLEDVPTPSNYLESAPDTIIGFDYSTAEGLVAKTVANTAGPLPVTRSDGKTSTINNQDVAPAAYTLSDWKLTAEHWDPPTDIYDIDTVAVKSNTTHAVPHLVPWGQIPGLETASGVGFYSSNFTWPPPNSSGNLGAMIDFGSIAHSIRVVINCNQIPALDLTHAQADITGYLKEGQNDIKVTSATTLWKVYARVFDKQRTSGSPPNAPLSASPGDEGLVRDPTITPYVRVVVT